MNGDGYALREHYLDHSRTRPLMVIEWKDTETSAVGYLAINSLRGGAAGGGTRMNTFEKDEYARKEAIDLAKTMELKFRVSGPDIGGAKSVISFTPTKNHSEEIRQEKLGVLRRWFSAIRPVLETRYGTGGDLNVDDKDVIEIAKAMGLSDPQQGIVQGHYGSEVIQRLENLQKGIPLVVEGVHFGPLQCKICDLVTGYGVAHAIRRYYAQRGEGIVGKRILIEGFGNVGAATAYFLDGGGKGASIVGITSLPSNPNDHEFRIVAIAKDERLPISTLVNTRDGRSLRYEAPNDLTKRIDQQDNSFWCTRADVFVPASASGTITSSRLNLVGKAGVELIACGANNPFVSFDVEKQADSEFAVIPDFVANCGMARTYAYFMGRASPSGADAWSQLGRDVETTIGNVFDVVWGGENCKSHYLDRAYQHYIPIIRQSNSRSVSEYTIDEGRDNR